MKNPSSWLEESIWDAHRAVSRSLSEGGRFLQPMANRLQELLELAAAEHPYTAIPTPAAIETFARGMQRLSVRHIPTVTLTADGSIWVEWNDASKRSAALAFHRDGLVSFGARIPRAAMPWRYFHVSEDGDMETVVHRVLRDADLRWLRHVERQK